MKFQRWTIVSIWFAFVFLIWACSVQAGSRSATSNSAAEAKKIKLFGKIDIVGSACQTAGITLASDTFPTLVKDVHPGSLAWQANVSENDKVVSAKVEKNQLVLAIERDGKAYSAHIDLSSDGLVQERASVDSLNSNRLPTSVQRFAPGTGRTFRPEIGGIYGEQAAAFRAKSLDDTWTEQDVNQSFVWGKEYHAETAGGVLVRPWCERFVKAKSLLTDYMNKHWPENLLGWEEYHLVIDRSGTVIQIFPHHHPVSFTSDRASFDKFAYAGITALSKARTFASPATSQVSRYHCIVVFENFHSLKGRY